MGRGQCASEAAQRTLAAAYGQSRPPAPFHGPPAASPWAVAWPLPAQHPLVSTPSSKGEEPMRGPARGGWPRARGAQAALTALLTDPSSRRTRETADGGCRQAEAAAPASRRQPGGPQGRGPPPSPHRRLPQRQDPTGQAQSQGTRGSVEAARPHGLQAEPRGATRLGAPHGQGRSRLATDAGGGWVGDSRPDDGDTRTHLCFVEVSSRE